MKILSTLIFLVILSSHVYAQSEIEHINNVLYDYIEGTANGAPDRLKKAFDENFNLYYVRNDSIQEWSGRQYINGVKPGRKSNRIGKVLAIDYEGNAASAKVEILMPDRKRIYTDYFLLLKTGGQWKIVHKSFTYKNYPE